MTSRQSLDPGAVAADVSGARKYAGIAPALVARIARAESPKAKSHGEAVKRTKRKLHQAVGAYLDTELPFDAWLAELAAAPAPAGRDETLRRILQAHASTRERSAGLEAFYAAIFAGLGEVATVVDLACGLGPMARPFMPLAPACRYGVFDAHQGIVDFDLRALALMGCPAFGAAVDLASGAADLAPDLAPADVVLLLKTLPLLAQLDPEAPHRLIASIRAPVLIVSYPIHSLGGGRRGMADFYRRSFHALAERLPRAWEELDVQGELVFRGRQTSDQRQTSVDP